MYQTTTTISKRISLLVCLVFVGCTYSFGQSNGATISKQSVSTEKPSTEIMQGDIRKNAAFQVSNVGAPEGDSFEARIARAEFYKAQYAHDPATQAKYQHAIEQLKQEQLSNSNIKKD